MSRLNPEDFDAVRREIGEHMDAATDWTPPHGIARPGVNITHPWRLLATLATFWSIVGGIVWLILR